MAFRFVAPLFAAMIAAGLAGSAIAADPVRTGPPPAGTGPAKIESSNRDHIDQDAQSKTNPNVPTNGIGGTGGGRLQTGTLPSNGGTINNNGTINDKR